MSLQGKWRIVETELWDSEFLDLMGPAYILLNGNGEGEFAFGCVTGQLHCRDTSTGVDFTWQGNDEMDEACGDGWADLQSDQSLAGEIRFHFGDDSNFTAKPWTSSTAC